MWRIAETTTASRGGCVECFKFVAIATSAALVGVNSDEAFFLTHAGSRSQRGRTGDPRTDVPYESSKTRSCPLEIFSYGFAARERGRRERLRKRQGSVCDISSEGTRKRQKRSGRIDQRAGRKQQRSGRTQQRSGRTEQRSGRTEHNSVLEELMIVNAANTMEAV